MTRSRLRASPAGTFATPLAKLAAPLTAKETPSAAAPMIVEERSAWVAIQAITARMCRPRTTLKTS